ncbi:type III secretion system export apparatus subunit SctS [Chlamydiales bacterium]|nr:type III secretion system export apparatus subunit SctS [Chlamydiales bacterium]
MFHSQLIQLAYQGLIMILVLSAPPVLISLILGLVVAVFQAATQIQEQTLASTVKLVAVVLTLVIMGSWLGAQVLTFASNIFNNFPVWSVS